MTEPRMLIGSRFQIGDPERDLIGRGGVGDVHRGTDLQTGKPVAIKGLRPEVVASDPNALARFLREGEALHRLNHPGIVAVIDGIEEDGRHYLVMEYVPGGSLRDLLEQEGRLSIECTIEIGLDVADALTRAHRLGILHRDLKPANVLLAEDGTPRLTDFGHAHLATSPRLTQTGTVIGTVLYLSPEACGGEELDARADIWAFGVMVYEMLTGQVPFPGETFPAVFMAILSHPVPDLSQARPDVPDALADLVYRMLEKDRAARIPRMRLVGAELEEILEAIRHPSAVVRHSSLPTSSRFATPPLPATTPEAQAHRTPDVRLAPHNLPAQTTPFVGREETIAEIEDHLRVRGCRLLTLVGPGGSGKTRLALEVAARQIDRFVDGVFFVPLAPVQSTEVILPAIAQAVGFAFYSGEEPKGQLLNYLRQKNVLLLLDNYEHLLADRTGGAARLATDILRAAPEVQILATSRAGLNVGGEYLYPVGGMDVPQEGATNGLQQCDAVQLYLSTALRIRPDLEPTAEDLAHIAQICRRVEGMPLAILLAASWSKMLTPVEIERELGREIAPSIDFLEADLRDVPARHRSMRAVFDHSWRLLPERAQGVFAGLSVFRGGFTREAAQQVTGASLRELRALVDGSLLHRGSNGRYEIHELLRQYVAEKLESSEARETVRDQHSAYYAGVLQQWGKDLRGPRQKTASTEIESDIENARAAWNWAAERRQLAYIAQAMDGLCCFYERRRRTLEGREACRLAVETLGGTHSREDGEGGTLDRGLQTLIKALAWQSVFERLLGHREVAHGLLAWGRSLLAREELSGRDVRAERAFLLLQSAELDIESDPGRARDLYERSLGLYRALGDRWWTARVLGQLGVVLQRVSEFALARQMLEEGLSLQRLLGDKMGIAGSLALLGSLAGVEGKLEDSERLVREAIGIWRDLGERAATADGLRTLSATLNRGGRFAAACPMLEQAAALYDEQGNVGAYARCLCGLSWAHINLGQYRQGRDSRQAALAYYRELDQQEGIAMCLLGLGEVAVAEGAFRQAQQLLEECVAMFDRMGMREHVALALDSLGHALRGLGQHDQAWGHQCKALRIAMETRAYSPAVFVVSAVALLLADRGQIERAVELYALAAVHSYVGKSRYREDIAGRHIAALAATLPPELVVAAQARGRARDLWTTAEELMIELER